MDVKALIIEQLDESGTLRTFRMQPGYRERLIVAFAEEYDEPRLGPFHFLENGYDVAYGRAFANCQTRKLGDSRFKEQAGHYSFDTSWQGIPTKRGCLTYYALSLPEFAVPNEIQITDPNNNGSQFRRTVYRDDQRNRFVIYLECRSKHGQFDFELHVKFRIEQQGFGSAQYSDPQTNSHGWMQAEYTRYMERREARQVQQYFAKEMIIMGDSYTAGQAGAMGPNANASDMRFQQIWQQSAADINLAPLSGELATLRKAMREEAVEPAHDRALVEIGKAEEAAIDGDGPKVLKHLRTAGKWALDVATKIGMTLAVEAIQKALV